MTESKVYELIFDRICGLSFDGKVPYLSVYGIMPHLVLLRHELAERLY